ncbi:pentatricopeptide repeat-containing protein At2g27610-like isoform X2 [Euphorbia lathyris]|uniref:pentatricopeptide repeat-containing protein At2g27610-like isoform X2 n=1 Tax=Euphorbia lathyris TaxID=212925 RepID=UPI0033142159
MAAPKLRLRQAIDSLYNLGPATHESYTRLALECFRNNDADQAKRLQSHMDIHLYQPTDTFLQNRLLHLYAKSGFAKNGRASEAVDAFVTMQNKGFKPTEYTYVSILNVCAQLLDLRKGKQVHGRILTRNLGHNAFIWNALTDMYAKCGEIDRAWWLFNRCGNKNLVSWNLMISGYLKNGQSEKCIDLFYQMQTLGLKPDQITFSNVLRAYFQSGYINEAAKLFAEIREKDKICWTIMIVGYEQNGKEEDALMLFNQMLSENVKPDKYTISSLVSSCAKLASLSHGQTIHGKALCMGVDDDLLVSSALIDMYCKCGVTTDAWFVFRIMPVRNVVSWNTMIGGYAQNGQDLEALHLYEKMVQEDMKPDNITFVGVLSACVHASLVEEGKKYFASMSKLHGLIPTYDHYACMINLLGRSGLMDEAMNLIATIPCEPNSLIWSTVLSVCAIKGDIKHGEIAARRLFELEPLSAGPYIMLSNMYAACGRWKDVASVRSLMKTRNVKKFAAYSWIEIDREVHKFVADDRTHPDTKIIYKKLDELISKLQKFGFTPNTNMVLHDVGEEEKRESICYHSEKLALAFGLIKKHHGSIRIIKNIRVCSDCHVFMKLVSKVTERPITLRDSNRFHHFHDGKCSCNDYW